MKTVRKIRHCLPKRNAMLQWLLPVLCLAVGIKLSAQIPTTLSVSDTRNGASVPKAYRRVVRFDFKYRSVIHAPGSGIYNGLFTLAPWTDASGGPSYQMSFDPSGIFLRRGNYTSDFVFDPAYQLPTLSSVKAYIKINRHLPDIPSASEMQAEGLSLGSNQTRLLQKTEEPILYLISQQEQIETMDAEIHELNQQNFTLNANSTVLREFEERVRSIKLSVAVRYHTT